jgi:hypothetical protein
LGLLAFIRIVPVPDAVKYFPRSTHGRLAASTYLQSLVDFKIESVFSSENVGLTLAEMALLPYLAFRRGY